MSQTLTAAATQTLLTLLHASSEARLQNLRAPTWADIAACLVAQPNKLWTLAQMEVSGGEVGVLDFDAASASVCFADAAIESPKNRRSLCYDNAALLSRKNHPPAGSAVALAEAMGAQLMDEAQYRRLQQWQACDLKTSTWLQTPAAVRDLGGALFGDCRYGQVFVYHNGADSYYAARGVRCVLSVAL